MSDRTTLLFALPAFRILDVTLAPDGGQRVLWRASLMRVAAPAAAFSRR
jgi:hypothetical protein